MPLYEQKCEIHGVQEVFARMSDDREAIKCPCCGRPTTPLVSRIADHITRFAGSGAFSQQFRFAPEEVADANAALGPIEGAKIHESGAVEFDDRRGQQRFCRAWREKTQELYGTPSQLYEKKPKPIRDSPHKREMIQSLKRLRGRQRKSRGA